MTVKEVVNVMGNQFIAVGRISDKKIGYSGSANNFSWYGADLEVVKIITPRDKNTATVIYVG